MSRKPVNPNAREALTQMKIEIANELGIKNESNEDKGNITSRSNGKLGGSLGGHMTKRLIEMAENQLINPKK